MCVMFRRVLKVETYSCNRRIEACILYTLKLEVLPSSLFASGRRRHFGADSNIVEDQHTSMHTEPA